MLHHPLLAQRSTRLIIALAVVYLVWGSTYLAIELAIAAIPPMLMMSVRFAVAGTALYLWASRRGDRRGDRPTPRQWRNAVVTGSMLLVGGTGLVALSIEWISSGTAALFAATVPVWMALFGRVMFGDRLTVRAMAGLVLGLFGIAILVDPAGGQAFGMLLALAGAITWALGSMRSRIVSAPSRPLVAASMEMIGASAMFLIVAVVRGEHLLVDIAAINAPAVAAVLYLTTAGSIVGFSAYRWLLLHASPTLVGTHAYVNPVVAVVLAWLVVGDQLTVRMLIAGAVVVVATAMVVTGRPDVPVPAQPTSGGDVFAGEARLRRTRMVGRTVARAPAAALRLGVAPVARGYRVIRDARRDPHARPQHDHGAHPVIEVRPEETI
ncbi:MAG: EamA family transporter [Nitriliruptoraceae bacterium]